MNDDWIQDAPCLGHAELMTEAHTDTLVREAVTLCAACPFTDACLDRIAAAGPPAADETDGLVAGGLAGRALEDEWRRRAPRRETPIRHGTSTGARLHYRRDEKPCQPCRIAAAIARTPNAAFRTTGWAS